MRRLPRLLPNAAILVSSIAFAVWTGGAFTLAMARDGSGRIYYWLGMQLPESWGAWLWRAYLPVWIVFTAALLASVAGRWMLGRRRGIGICPACGYDLRATPKRCPECGTVPATT